MTDFSRPAWFLGVGDEFRITRAPCQGVPTVESTTTTHVDCVGGGRIHRSTHVHDVREAHRPAALEKARALVHLLETVPSDLEGVAKGVGVLQDAVLELIHELPGGGVSGAVNRSRLETAMMPTWKRDALKKRYGGGSERGDDAR